MDAASSHRLNRTKIAVVASAVLLAAIVSGLLLLNHKAQKSVRHSVWLQFYHDAERMGESLSYFFSERDRDMLDLSRSREFSIFFENKALGMSMSYGLQASLGAITEKLTQVLSYKTFHAKQIYDRIIFIGNEDEVFCDTRDPEDTTQSTADWKPYLQPEIRSPAILNRSDGDHRRIMLSLAFYYKGRFSGQILAWLSRDLLERHLLKSDSDVTRRHYGLLAPGGVYYVSKQDQPFFHNNPSILKQGESPQKPFPDALTGIPFLALRVPVIHTPFQLVTVAPEQEVYGQVVPWHLTMVLGILTLITAGTTAILWRFDNQNTRLNTRLEEIKKRESAIQEKNLQLEKEIRRRELMEKALRDSESKYRNIFDSFPDVYFRTNRENCIEVVSPSIKERMGYEPEELIGESIAEVLENPLDQKVLTETLTRNQSINDYEFVIVSKDGERMHVSLNARLIVDRHEGYNGIEGVLRDITQRKRDEKKIQDSRTRLDLALKGGDLDVWDWEIQSGKLTFSSRWSEMLEYSMEELEPTIQFWKTLLHPEEKEDVIRAMDAHINGKTPFYEAEYRVKTGSGTWKWILDRGQVVEKNPDNLPCIMAGTHMDVTLRKMAELEVLKYQENLENLVEERTAELQQAQKELVNKAIEAGRAQLAAMVLHNIGNAITPVNVLLDTLKRQQIDQIVFYLGKCHHEILQTIETREGGLENNPRIKSVVAYLGQLIGGLEETGKTQVQTVEEIVQAVSYISEILVMQQSYAASEQEIKSMVNLNEIMRDSIRMQTTSLEKRGITVIEKLDPDDPQLIIDKNRLMQLIINIIKNGFEAIEQNNDPNAEKTMTFETENRDTDVGFTIRDTGIGADAGEIDRLFEFGQSGKGSSGMGLYYCKMFAEANQGELEFKSDGHGQGASVSIRFHRT